MNIVFDYDKGYNPVFRINMVDTNILHTYDTETLLHFVSTKYLLNEWSSYALTVEGTGFQLENIPAPFVPP